MTACENCGTTGPWASTLEEVDGRLTCWPCRREQTEEESGAPPRTEPRSPLLSVTDLGELKPPRSLIEEMITAEGFNGLYGPSGCGKSLLALDWALSVATGTHWHGQRTTKGSVVFIAGEGASGLYPRIEEWCRAREVEIDRIEEFRVLPEPLNLYAGKTDALAAAIDALGLDPDLIVIDTVARCMVGGDENSARDMGLFIEHADELRRRYGVAILVVHHTGKTGDLERGSSALRAAADTLSLLKPDGSGLKLSCEKQKDAAPYKTWHLHRAPGVKTVSIEVGTVLGQTSPQEGQILEAVSASFGTDWASTTKVKEVSDLPKTSFYRCLKSLVDAGKLEEREVGPRRKEYRIAPAEDRSPKPSQTVPRDAPKTVPPTPTLLGSGTGGEGGTPEPLTALYDDEEEWR